ncbi:unnamed protein product, partial [Ixodes persulcatus]
IARSRKERLAHVCPGRSTQRDDLEILSALARVTSGWKSLRGSADARGASCGRHGGSLDISLPRRGVLRQSQGLDGGDARLPGPGPRPRAGPAAQR